MPNQGQRHHYIPVCYLKQWLNRNNQICQYSKPFDDKVVPDRLHPSATGYVRGLYDFRGVEDRLLRETLEREFLRPVDTRAAELLREMIAGKQTMNNPEKRSAWTTFLLSLMLRMPEDIEAHKQKYLADWYETDPQRRKFYKKIWKLGMPNRVEDLVAKIDPREVEWRAMEALVPLMTNPRIGQYINRMKWGTLTLPTLSPPLLASDRPLIVSDGLISRESHILMPIGPRHIFYAFNDRQIASQLQMGSPTELAHAVNRAVVQQAVKYVYAQWDVHKPFVQKHMGTALVPSLREKMKDTAAAEKGYRRLQRMRRQGLLP